MRLFLVKVEDRIVYLRLVFSIYQGKGSAFMTTLRQSAIKELEKIPEDKISFLLQIMQGINGLYDDEQSEREEAFARLEQLRKKGTVIDAAAELASYREEKYGG